MKKLRIALLSSLAIVASAAVAQNVTNHAVPIGRGTGVVGWGIAGPCNANQALVWSGAGADPGCSTVIAGGTTTSPNAVFAGPASGAPSVATFRFIVDKDIEGLSPTFAGLSSTGLFTATTATFSGTISGQSWEGSADVRAGAGNSIYWENRAKITSPADSQLLLRNNASLDFQRLMFGGTTSAFPALVREGSSFGVKLADNSAYTGISAQTLYTIGDVSAGGKILGALSPMATKTILSNMTGGDASPIANTLSSILDTVLGSTQGNVIYRGPSVWTVLAPGVSGQTLQTGGSAQNPSWNTVAGTGTVTNVNPGNGITVTPNPITVSGTVAVDIASTAQILSATASKIADGANLTSSISPVAIPDAATLTPDFSQGNNFYVAMTSAGGVRTLANPAGTVYAGRTGCIWFKHTATGGETLSLGTNWITASSAGVTLTTTTASAIDLVCYSVLDANHIYITLTAANVKH